VRIASIDIGTNTILLLVADGRADDGLAVVTDEQVIARVGRGVDASRRIAPDAFDRCADALLAFAARARALGAECMVVTGTSAIRDAANRGEFLDAMLARTGLPIEVLGGEDEALLTYTGGVSGQSDPAQPSAVLDIGGGSTELTLGANRAILARKSLDIGCVRLTEKFLPDAPPREADLARALEHIDDAVRGFPHFDGTAIPLIGVAGTVTTLAALELDLDTYDRARVGGVVLRLETVEQRFTQLRGLTHDQMVRLLRVDPGRADIILIGVAILRAVMRARNCPSVRVSDRGLRYGVALRALSTYSSDTIS
jgi:exopolyphosphatase / guanosine-5'-triphosphate,3'-diphosphate pyrophosphatase